MMRRLTLVSLPLMAFGLVLISSEPCWTWHVVVVLVVFVLMFLSVVSVVMDLWDERRLQHLTFRQMLKSTSATLLLTGFLVALSVTSYPTKWRFLASLSAFEALRVNEAAAPGEVVVTPERRFEGLPIERRVGFYHVKDVWQEGDALRVRCCDGFTGPLGFTYTHSPEHPSDITVHMVDNWYWWRYTK